MASWYNGTRAIVLADPAPARHQHDRGRRRDQGSCCPTSQRSCRRRSSSTSCTTARNPIRDSVHDVQFTLMLAIVLVVLVIFLFLRNLSATIIPSLALPISIIGTFARDVAVRLQPRQPLADGADAVGRLRRRRRHRHAREHRPPHGDGQAARCRRRSKGSDEIGFTIISMTLSLVGGVHPGAVHGRHPRPAAARVRGDDQRRDPGLRLRLAHADADAVQPLPEAASTTTSTAGSTIAPSGSSRHASALYDRTLNSVAASRRCDHARRRRC